ncbi:CPBP family glutamic-type intramembrane protease [Gracilibacillus sp. YIM 98692]|uniref:CPBP family glutamic-type intramembrane protease n=1 Tax=Gracilibacillus sp. YIM 98692 TaxID=2663532 RepID=UPI0013D24957|nr:CPBP family glutamic-type intramembrane protease [Gracilibacillus sp. YIM 98692]
MKRKLKYVVYFTLVAIISYLISIPYMLQMSKPVIENINQMGVPITPAQYVLGNGINIIVMAIVFSLIGVLLASKVGLKWDWIQSLFDKTKKTKWDKRYVWFSILWGIGSTIVISIMISTVFSQKIPQFIEINQNTDMTWWVGITTVFQGGISEELIMRFGLMTLVVWILSSIFARTSDSIPAWIYYISIIIAAFAFALGHLPLAQSIYGGLTFWVVTFIVLGNGFAGLGFGFLYWKKGLEYAIISHMTADLMLHFVLPLLTSIF